MHVPPHKVLLVDDDEDYFVIVRGKLAEVNGMSIELCCEVTYDAGLAAMRTGGFAACLVDFRLGARDGLELMREARAGGCRAPFILLTGQGDHETDVQAMHQGIADYLVKDGLTGTAIERSIRYAIERSRAQEQRLQDAAQLRLLTEQVQAILWTTDLTLHFTSGWGGGLQGLGLTTNQLVGRTLYDYFQTGDENHDAIAPHRRALEGESVVFQIDWMGRTFRAQANPLRDEQDNIVGTVGIAVDVTDARRVEDELSAARRIQEWLLPKDAPSIPGFDLAGICRPADATGGDYFDYIPMQGGQVGIVIADVSRHGFASALVMSATRRGAAHPDREKSRPGRIPFCRQPRHRPGHQQRVLRHPLLRLP